MEETNIKKEKTFIATIYVGLQKGYAGSWCSKDTAVRIIQAYVNEVGLCVTVKDTTIIYSLGGEDGLEIGLTNYPRFPSSPEKIVNLSLELADLLMKELCQNRVTVVTTDTTYMLTNHIQYD